MEPIGALLGEVVDAKSLKNMVGPCGLEPQTSTVSADRLRSGGASSGRFALYPAQKWALKSKNPSEVVLLVISDNGYLN